MVGVSTFPREDFPPPEIVDQVEGQGRDCDEGLAEQEVDVDLVILHQLWHESDAENLLIQADVK